MSSNDGGGRRLRILHLIHNLRPTNSCYNEHSLPVMNERDISLCTYFTPQLVPPDQIRVFAGNDSLRGFFRTLREALGFDFDAVHAHSPQTGVFMIMAMVGWRRFDLRRSTVYTVHDSFYDYKLRNKLLMVVPLIVFRRIVFCSHAAFQSFPGILRRLVGRRARVVQNGANIDRIDRVLRLHERTGTGPFTVLSIGRLERVKDPLVVLDAFVAGCDAESRLIFIGEGPLRQQLERRIADHGLESRVTLTGLIERDAVFRHLRDSDVYVSTSHGEGLPVAVMEAMACSIPVILSDIPPHRELSENADIVPLVTLGDVEGFARELSRLQSLSREERASIGRAGRKVVADGFSLDQMNAGYEAIYREIGSS